MSLFYRCLVATWQLCLSYETDQLVSVDRAMQCRSPSHHQARNTMKPAKTENIKFVFFLFKQSSPMVLIAVFESRLEAVTTWLFQFMSIISHACKQPEVFNRARILQSKFCASPSSSETPRSLWALCSALVPVVLTFCRSVRSSLEYKGQTRSSKWLTFWILFRQI